MINKLIKRNFIFGFLLVLILLFIPINSIYAYLAPVSPSYSSGTPPPPTAQPLHLTGLVGVFSALIGLLYAIITLVLFIVVLLNGFKYLFSGVNPDLKDQARKDNIPKEDIKPKLFLNKFCIFTIIHLLHRF